MPRVVEADWLAFKLGAPGLKIVDLRPQNVESFRGNIGGVSSMLLPPSLLAAQFSLMGLRLDDAVVLVSGAELHDATLVGIAFERLSHMS